MKILNSLLNAQIPNEFFSKHFTKMPFSMPDTAAAYLHLLNWGVVEKVIAEKKSVLRIVKDGVLEKDHAELDFLEAKKYYDKGHTLLLRYAEKSHPLLKDLATEDNVAIYQDAFAQLGEDLKTKFENPQFIQSFIEYAKNRNYA